MKNCSAGTTGPAIANDDDEDDKPVLVNEPSDPFREKRFQLYIKKHWPSFQNSWSTGHFFINIFLTSAKRPNSHGRFRQPGSSWKPWTCRNYYQKCWKVFFLEKGQKQVLFSVLKIRGYKVQYLRMDLSRPMTWLCGNRQKCHISDSPSRINSSKCFSYVFMLFRTFLGAWNPKVYIQPT